MGAQMEVVKDLEGNKHIIFDESSFYDDSQMGESLSDFEILQVLGENSCFVAKVRSFNNHKIYAMKKIELSRIEEEKRYNYINELEKLKDLNNPHILKYHKIIKEDPNNIYLIMEFMNNSDIKGYIKAHQVLDKKIKEEEIWNILLQCLEALDYLHRQNLYNLGIKFQNIFMNNEQNVKIGVFNESTFNNQTYDFNKDMDLLGRYFYIMCFSQHPRVKFANSFSDVTLQLENNNDYSLELMNIIYSMIGVESSEKHDYETLYKIVKKEYVKKYAKNTSIKAVLKCLYAFPSFTEAMISRKNDFFNNPNKYYISYWYLQAINALKGIQESNLTDCIEEFRRAIASENSKLDGNREIDPLYLLAFLLEKMHKETNKTEENSTLMENTQKYVISSEFNGEEEDKTNKEQMLQKFVNYFNSNVRSPISDLFFGFLKTKRNCQTCRTGYYSFSNYCFVVFDISKFDSNKVFDIINDGFTPQYKIPKPIEPDQPERAYCDRCLSFQRHLEFNRYFMMNHLLVISFIRGNNYKNSSKINLSDHLDLEKYVDEKKTSPSKYNLVGCIIRVFKQNEEMFEYYAKDPEHDYWLKSDKIINQKNAPIQEITKEGQIIMLFYNNTNIPNNNNYQA